MTARVTYLAGYFEEDTTGVPGPSAAYPVRVLLPVREEMEFYDVCLDLHAHGFELGGAWISPSAIIEVKEMPPA